MNRTTRTLPLLALLTAALFAAGCAGAGLRRQWEEQPHGTFAPQALAAARQSAAEEEAAPPLPASPPPGPEAAAETPPPALAERRPAPTEGPVRPEDLAAGGIDPDLPDLDPAALQAADWQPGRALPYRATRAAFLLRNPDVAAAVERYRASFTRYNQVDWLNDLVRQYEAFGREMRTPGAMTPRTDQRQMFPFRGPLALQGEIVDVDVASARVRLEQDLREALVRFEEAWQGARYWQREVAVLAEIVELAQRVVTSAEARYRAGQTPHASLIQAQMRHADLRERLTTARRQLDAERAVLAALLDLPPDRAAAATLRLDVGLPSLPSREDTRAAALDHGPMMEMARLDVARMTLMVQLVERQLLPNLSPGLSYEQRSGAPKPRGDIRYATGGPFLEELRHRLEAAQQQLEQAQRLVPARAERAWVMVDDARRRRQLNAGAQSERAEQAVEVAARGYDAGTASFLDLDQALRWQLDVSLAAADALRDAFVEEARRMVVVGAPLPSPPTRDPTQVPASTPDVDTE